MHSQQEVISWLVKEIVGTKPSNANSNQYIETHISHVIIGPKYAYKVKKDIKLDFLDFSTLDKRKHFCNEEIRLNRANAPLIYLEVVPIYQNTKGSLSFKSSNDTHIVEYAIKMKSFDQSAILHQCLDDPSTNTLITNSTASKLFESHRNAKVIYGPDYGSYDGFLKMGLDIIDQSRQIQIIPDEQIELYKSWFVDTTKSHQTLLNQRNKDGFVRECHGDLHLNNICIIDNQMQFFDCIEFNDLYKFIDTLYDLSFLLMDLEAHKKAIEANTILNQYLEISGDYSGASLLPLYKSLRACIRFLVIGIASNNSTDQKESLKSTAINYVSHFLSPINQRKPTIYIMTGFSGSGKSTIGKIVAQATNAIHIRSDAVRKHLLTADKDYYSESNINNVYQYLKTYAYQITNSNQNVVLDATYLNKENRNEVISLCNEHYIDYKFIQCHAKTELLEKWINERKNDLSDADISVLHEQIKNHDPLTKDELKHTIRIDTAQHQDLNSISSLLNMS